MKISLIVALSENRVLALNDGGIPWSLPRDKAHFRRYTANKWMLLGRSTYEEMSGWFESQTPLILTSWRGYRPPLPSHRVVSSVPEAISLAQRNGIGELVVSGGASVYEASLPYVDRLILTWVQTEVEPGNLFPDFQDISSWETVYKETWPADQENAFDMRLELLDRRRES